MASLLVLNSSMVCTLIPLAYTSSWSHQDFYSRKYFYTISSMIVCDNNKRITMLHFGYAGSAHDSRVYNGSPLANATSTRFSNDEYLLADSAYAPSLSIVPVFKKPFNAELSGEDKQFNFLHARARVKSEHCIGILKARFQCLRELRVLVRDRTSVARVNAWVKVCCVLHNFLLDIKDGIDNNWERPLISRQDSVESSDPVNINNGQSSSNCRIVVNENLPLNEARNGVEKRLILKRILEATF